MFMHVFSIQRLWMQFWRGLKELDTKDRRAKKMEERLVGVKSIGSTDSVLAATQSVDVSKTDSVTGKKTIRRRLSSVGSNITSVLKKGGHDDISTFSLEHVTSFINRKGSFMICRVLWKLSTPEVYVVLSNWCAHFFSFTSNTVSILCAVSILCRLVFQASDLQALRFCNLILKILSMQVCTYSSVNPATQECPYIDFFTARSTGRRSSKADQTSP